MAKRTRVQVPAPAVAPTVHATPTRPVVSTVPLRALRRAIQRAFRAPESLSHADKRRLQRALGTQGAAALIARGQTAPPPQGVQTKLTVGAAGDRYEREADAVAGQVMRQLATPTTVQRSMAAPPSTTAAPGPSTPAPTPATPPPAVQASPAAVMRTPGLELTATTTEEMIQESPATELTVQRAIGAEGGPVDEDVDRSIRQAQGGGRPLDGKVRGSMEQAFGADFSSVRVHTNSQADTLNRSLSARAFTTGQDVFFRKGAYNPGSSGGQKLLAHELTHVVQQSGSAIQRRPAADTPPPVTGLPPRITRMAQRQAVQRQLTFDSSWDGWGYGVGYLSGYNKDAEQGKLSEPFDEIELILGEVTRDKRAFVNPNDQDNLETIQLFVEERKKTPVKWGERDALAKLLKTQLVLAKGLRSAARQVPESRPVSSSVPESVQSMQLMVFAVAMQMYAKQNPELMTRIKALKGDKEEDEAPSEAMTDVDESSGVITLRMPGPPHRTVLSAELTNFNASLEKESSVTVSKLRLSINPHQTMELPATFDLTYMKGQGFKGRGRLTDPVKINDYLTIEQLSGKYASKQLSLEGLAQVNLPGTDPFETKVQYTTEEGLVVSAKRIDLRLPQIKGVDSQGVLSELKYSSATGFFSGRGLFEARFPILGPVKAGIAVHQNKLQKVTLDFDEIAYPQARPAVKGEAHAQANFDEHGKFAEGTFDTNLKISLPDAKGEPQESALTAGATLKNGKFDAHLNLSKDVYINEYLTLRAVAIKVEDGEIKGGGTFKTSGVLGQDTLPFDTSSSGDLTEPPPANLVKKGKELSTDVKFGFEWDTGFWARGIVNMPISPWDEKMLTGVITYTGGKLSASVEAGDAVLVPQIPFVKPLFNLEKSVLLRGIGKRGGDGKAGLGGIYATAALNLSFFYNFGPLMVDAYATLRNIDLGAMKAELDPLHIKEVRGGLTAELKGRPSLGLGAYVLNEKLLNVQGGIEMPIAGVFKADVVAKLPKLTYKDGKFGSEGKAGLELPLVFGLSGKLQPYINIYALGGMIDLNPSLTPIDSIEFMAARKLVPSEIDLNTLRNASAKVLEKLLPSDLDAAPEAEAEEPTVAPGAKVLEVRAKPPAPVSSKPPKDGMPSKPINVQALLAKVATGLQLDRLEQLYKALLDLADKFGITGGIEKVLNWMESYGLLAPLRASAGLVDKLIELVTDAVSKGVDLTLAALWDLLGVDPAKFKEKVDEVREVASSLSDVQGERLVLTLGPSRIWVDVATTAGSNDGTVAKNPLEENGIKLLTQPKAKLNFDSHKKLTGGTVQAELVIGDFARVENVTLAVDAKKAIAQKFTGATLKPNQEKLTGVNEREIHGEFLNTQFFLDRVSLDTLIPAPAIANPLPAGGEQMKSAKDIELSFQRLNDEWMLTGQGVKFGAVAVKVTLLKYTKNDKGEVTATGEIRVTWEKRLRAVAKVDMVAGEFKNLEFHIETNQISWPAPPQASPKGEKEGESSQESSAPSSESPVEGGSKPMISGYLFGGFAVQNRKLHNMNVGARVTFTHESMNQGKPVLMEGKVEADATWKYKAELGLKTAPVDLFSGLATVSKLMLKYDSRSRKAEVDGKVKVKLPGGKAGGEVEGEQPSTPPSGTPSMVPSTPQSQEAPAESGTIEGSLTYKDGEVVLDLKGSKVGYEYVDFDQLKMSYARGKGWQMGAKATLKNIKGFEKIQASVSLGAEKLAFRFEPGDKVEPTQPPGIGLTAAFTTLEYGLKTKKLSGAGNLGIVVPLGGASVRAGGTFAIKDNKLTDFAAEVSLLVKVPTAQPVFQGLIKGTLRYGEDGLEGGLDGMLAVIPEAVTGGKEGESVSKEGESGGKKKDEAQEKLRFSVRMSKNGVSGQITQTGDLSVGEGMLVFKDLHMAVNPVPDVKKTVANLNAQSQNGDKLVDVIKRAGLGAIERRSDFSGSGKIVADLGSVGRGALNLTYGDGEFKKSYGRLSLGPDPDKNAKPGIAGEIRSSYSSREGFALEGGSLTANITPGLQAKGVLEKQDGSALSNGLNAKLEIKASFFKDMKSKKLLYTGVHRPVFPIIPGVVSGYGELGADLSLEYGVSPMAVEGTAQLTGLNLKERTFERAYVHIHKHKEKEKGDKNKKGAKKDSGSVFGRFVGKPYFGVGAAMLHPGLAGISGGIEIPLTAEASVEPDLDAKLLYDEKGKLKGRFKLDMPLVMGVKVDLSPYLKLTALAGLIDATWRPEKPWLSYDLIKPRVMIPMGLDFGNLKDDDLDPSGKVPSSAEQMPLASEKQAEEQAVKEVTSETPAPVPTLPPKEGDAEPTESMGNEGPFSLSGLKKRFMDGLSATVETAKKIYANVKAAAQKLGELVGKAGGAIGSGAKTVATTVSTAVTDVANWIWSYFDGKPDVALKELSNKEELNQVKSVEKLNWKKLGLGSEGFGYFSMRYGMGFEDPFSGSSLFDRRHHRVDFGIDIEEESSPSLFEPPLPDLEEDLPYDLFSSKSKRGGMLSSPTFMRPRLQNRRKPKTPSRRLEKEKMGMSSSGPTSLPLPIYMPQSSSSFIMSQIKSGGGGGFGLQGSDFRTLGRKD